MLHAQFAAAGLATLLLTSQQDFCLIGFAGRLVTASLSAFKLFSLLAQPLFLSVSFQFGVGQLLFGGRLLLGFGLCIKRITTAVAGQPQG